VCAGAPARGGRAPADEEPDRADEDRLSGAGFARQHGETRMKLEFELVDDSEVADGQVPEHVTTF
jgi:hypothetical protein